MTITVRAVYEHGVLRPLDPLSLPEGDTVAVTIARVGPEGGFPGSPTMEESQYAQRLQAAGSLDEMLAVMGTAPPLPGGYDLPRALDAN
jgi:predicted DNA-binding antitoxin AbrB/MazE fold protein